MKFDKRPIWIIVKGTGILTAQLEGRLESITAFDTRREALEFKKRKNIKGTPKKIKEIITN